MSSAHAHLQYPPFWVRIGSETHGFATFDDAERCAKQLVTAQRHGAEIHHTDGLAARVAPHIDGGTRTDLEQLGVMLESVRGAETYGQAMKVRELIRHAPIPFRTNKAVRDSLIGVLTRGRIGIADDPLPGLKIQPTLYLPAHGIALEFVSKFEPLSPIWDRLERFAAHGLVQALLLVRHADAEGVPVSIGGKPLLCARVGGRR